MKTSLQVRLSAAREFFVQLCQLPRHRSPTFSQHLERICKRIRYAMRRFIKHKCSRQTAELLQSLPPCLTSGRQESCKENSSVGMPDATSADIIATGPGIGTTVNRISRLLRLPIGNLGRKSGRASI